MAKSRKAPRKGQFGHPSRGGRSSRPSTRRASSSTSTALVRAAPAQIIRVSAPRPPAKKQKGGKRRHAITSSGGVSTSLLATLKAKSKGLAGSVGYGWITASGSESAVKVKEYLDKVPTLDTIGKPASHGLIATFVATRTKGMVRTVFDAFGTGALHRASYNFGASGFSLEKAAAVGADDEMSGDIDVDD